MARKFSELKEVIGTIEMDEAEDRPTKRGRSVRREVVRLEDVKEEEIEEAKRIYPDPYEDSAFLELTVAIHEPTNYDDAMSEFIVKYPEKAKAYMENPRSKEFQTFFKSAFKRQKQIEKRDALKIEEEQKKILRSQISGEYTPEEKAQVEKNPYDDPVFRDLVEAIHTPGNYERAIKEFIKSYPEKTENYRNNPKSGHVAEYLNSTLKRMNEPRIEKHKTQIKQPAKRPQKKNEEKETSFWAKAKSFLGGLFREE